MKQPVQRQPDPLLVQAGAPDAAIVAGPCGEHGNVLVQYCEVITQDLQPALVAVFQLTVSLN